MERAINESMIINEISLKRNINESMIINEGKRSNQVRRTDYIADKLTKIYDAPQSHRFFLKCAWHLSEDVIWAAVENSRKPSVKSPVRYFVAVCNKALRERPSQQ